MRLLGSKRTVGAMCWHRAVSGSVLSEGLACLQAMRSASSAPPLIWGFLAGEVVQQVCNVADASGYSDVFERCALGQVGKLDFCVLNDVAFRPAHPGRCGGRSRVTAFVGNGRDVGLRVDWLVGRLSYTCIVGQRGGVTHRPASARLSRPVTCSVGHAGPKLCRKVLRQ